jgi:hypothetical protein
MSLAMQTAHDDPPTPHHPPGSRQDPPLLDPSQYTLSRTRKLAYLVVVAVLLVSVVGLLLMHALHSSGGSGAKAAEGSTTTTAASVTTTTALPTALKPDPQTAAQTLVSSWAAGNKVFAISVATPNAVDTLFAVPYHVGLAEARGCSTAFTPIVCSFGPPGGASPKDQIYQIDVSQAAGGWYVSDVKVQN